MNLFTRFIFCLTTLLCLATSDMLFQKYLPDFMNRAHLIIWHPGWFLDERIMPKKKVLIIEVHCTNIAQSPSLSLPLVHCTKIGRTCLALVILVESFYRSHIVHFQFPHLYRVQAVVVVQYWSVTSHGSEGPANHTLIHILAYIGQCTNVTMVSYGFTVSLLWYKRKERIIQVQSFSIQSLYSWTKLTQQNERHLIIKLCTCIITVQNKSLKTSTWIIKSPKFWLIYSTLQRILCTRMIKSAWVWVILVKCTCITLAKKNDSLNGNTFLLMNQIKATILWG